MNFYKQISEPLVEPVTLAEAKEHAIIDSSLGADDDALITALIISAREHVELFTRQAMITRPIRLTIDSWDAMWVRSQGGGYGLINRLPFQIVTAINIVAEDGSKTLVDATTYYSNPDVGGGVIANAGASTMPKPERDFSGIEIDFKVGYGDAPTDVPEPLRLAVKMLVVHWYEHREAVAVGDDAKPAISAGVPVGFVEILSRYRSLRMA